MIRDPHMSAQTGLTNLDSGDSAGDAFFGLFELGFPLACTDPGFRQGPNCKNLPILNIPNFNVYTSFILEADTRHGDYAECNPNPQTGVFECAHMPYTENFNCWYDNPQWATEFAHECSRVPVLGCKCDAVLKKSLGQRAIVEQFGGGALPGGCSASLQAYKGIVLQGDAIKTTSVSRSAA